MQGIHPPSNQFNQTIVAVKSLRHDNDVAWDEHKNLAGSEETPEKGAQELQGIDAGNLATSLRNKSRLLGCGKEMDRAVRGHTKGAA